MDYKCAPWGKDLWSMEQLNLEYADRILVCAEVLEPYSGRGNKLDICKGEILYRLFFEPSTRTHGSFGAAMVTLGGALLDPPERSSLEKKESKEDMVRTVAQFSDILVIRDDTSGSVEKYARLVSIPVINAGDGSNEHPTQTLLDLRTMKKEFGTLEGLDVVYVGDLLNGRTVHSNIRGIRMYPDNRVYGIAPRGLELPDYLKGPDYKQITFDDIYDINPHVIYVTRIQEERIPDQRLREQFNKEKELYTITRAKISGLRSKIMHPLPRVGEIADDVLGDPHERIFKQVRHGLETRMAILAIMLGHEKEVLSLPRAC